MNRQTVAQMFKYFFYFFHKQFFSFPHPPFAPSPGARFYVVPEHMDTGQIVVDQLCFRIGGAEAAQHLVLFTSVPQQERTRIAAGVGSGTERSEHLLLEVQVDQR